MMRINTTLNSTRNDLNWITIREAILIANQLQKTKLTESDIYRHALYGNIRISIYFQSPVALRKIRTSNYKVILREVSESLNYRLCYLEKKCFINKRKLIISPDEKNLHTTRKIIDTNLIGYEHFLIQRLLAISLDIPMPLTGANNVNYGLTVIMEGELFQIVEKITWMERIEKQLRRLPNNIASEISQKISSSKMSKYHHQGYFPVHDLPKDACFVIRYAELEKLINMPSKINNPSDSPTRISSPLSRMFWLACKHNETISPLIRQPYKLLSIFEQWALDDGITDRLSGDTLKTALERGSPPSA